MTKVTVVKIIIGIYFGLVNAKCGDDSLNITNKIGVISSPNYGNEYGLSADCTWRFHLPSPSNALIITFTNLKMYLWNTGNHWYCPIGYNVKINKRKLECPIYVDGSTSNPEFCYAYYNSDGCDSIIRATSCKHKQKGINDVVLKYQSDGNKALKQGKLYFRLKYEVIECKETSSSTTTSTSRTSSTISVLASTTVPTAVVANSNIYLSETAGVSTETSFPARTENTLNEINGGGNNATIIALVVTGTIIAILIIAALWYLKRQKANSSNNQKPAVIYESAHDSDPDSTLTGTIDYYTTSTSRNREAEDVYVEIDKGQTNDNNEQAVNITYDLAQETPSSGQSQRQNTHAIADVYASVNKTRDGTKNTIHHEKVSVDNMLYGATSN